MREADGLACSSRNQYLNPDEREQAAVLQRGLQKARELAAGGERSAAAMLAVAREEIATAPLARIDYLELVDGESLQPIPVAGANSVIVVAAFFGQTRLIDNIRLQ